MASCAYCGRPWSPNARDGAAVLCSGCGAPTWGHHQDAEGWLYVPPSLCLEVVGPLSDERRAELRRQWEERFAGTSGARRLAVLEGPPSPPRPARVPPTLGRA